MVMAIYLYGNGEMGIWRYGNRDMENEIWEQGYMWTQGYENRDIGIEMLWRYICMAIYIWELIYENKDIEI